MGYLNPHTHNLDDAPGHVVTICGSTRFRAEMTEANRRLTLGGYIVLAPGVFAHDGDEMTDAQKVALDRLHLSKIDMAGWVYVVNPGGYIGESTRREIEYAASIDKPVQYLVPLATQPTDQAGGA
jgi:dienelactone hydrolase